MSPPPVSGEPVEIPADWGSALDDLAVSARILVLGASDRGKSTFCGLLRERLLAAGRGTALVDADIGQKDLGPPATITLGLADPGGAPETVPSGYYFVGSVSPRGHLLPVVVGTRRLAEEAGDRVAVVNTPGMIHGVGRILQDFQLESLRPDAVVALEKNGEAGAILGGHKLPRIHRLAPSTLVRAKTPAQRRAARTRAFRDYFTGALAQEWDLAELAFQRSLLFTGRPVDPGPHLHAEETAEGRLVVGGPEPRDPGTKRLPAGFERGLLCGVADGEGCCRGLARLKGIDFAARRVSLSTPVPAHDIAAVQLGDLYVGADGRELDRRRPRIL